MASTRNVLERIKHQLDESMGVRPHDAQPLLSPVPSIKDMGRRALRSFGTLSIENIVPDPEQPRIEFSVEEIDQLAHSIREKGQLHPIRVRWSEQLSKWIIISGERRYRANLRAGLQTIDCHFHDGDLTKSEILEQQLIENLLRSDLRPMEEAKAFQQLIELNGWTGKELSQAIHVSQSRVTRSLALLKLPQNVQAKVETGELSPSAAYELSKIPDDEDRRRALDLTTSRELTRDELTTTIRMPKPRKTIRPRGVKRSFVSDNGWTVIVSAKHQGNYHEVEQALDQALTEVRHRIANNVRL